VKFLVDAQLPPILVQVMRPEGYEADHVFNLNLKEAEDGEIAVFAADHGYAVISKDEDFSRRCDRAPPLIWVRLGNCKNRRLIDVVLVHLPSAIALIEAGENLVEISGEA